MWAEAEKTRGQFDWSAADAIVDRFRAEKHEPVIDLWGGHPLYTEEILGAPTAAHPDAVEGWERFVREAARHFKGRVRFFQIGKTPNAQAIWGKDDSAKSYAFLLKKTASIVRAEAKGSLIVMGGLAGPDTAWLGRLLALDVIPYFDIVSFRPDSRVDLATQAGQVRAALLSQATKAAMWMEAVGVSGKGEEAGRDIVRKLLLSFDHGASAVFFALPYADTGLPAGGEFLVRVHSALAAGMGRVPAAERITFVDASGAPVTGVRAVCFYDPDQGVSVTGYWFEGETSPQKVIARIVASRLGQPTVYDPVTGQQSQPTFEAESQGAKGEVPLGPSPLLLVYRESKAAGAEPGSESLEVSAARGITAEEVIAKYREFQAAQDARLSSVIADAMINFHFRLAGSSRTIDVGMAGSYYYDPKGGAEWELKDYYLNGNKSRWKQFPELPLIQPEKVLTLPLDITFDRSYTYESAGEDTVEGRACHVLSFAPVDPEKTLYRGKVWIDKTTWARVRVASIQTKLDPPILSSEEKTTYEPMKGPEGDEDLWIIKRIDGQQIYSASGRNFVVLREITFSNPRINDKEFAGRREMAHESDHQILKDTDKGFRYFVKNEAGERVVKDEINTRQFFGLAGVIDDPSLERPVPLLGVNYFDYDFKKTGIQTNLFFAGALLSLNATNPNIWKSGFDLGGDLFLSALSREDKDFRLGEEITERQVKRREQSIAFNLGRETGNFVKLRATYELAFHAYDRGDDTDHAFILPKDTLTHTSSLIGSFNRAGYDLRGSVSYSVRSQFGFWGDPCQPSNPSRPPRFCAGLTRRARERRALLAGDDFNRKARGFYLYQADFVKEFFLPSFQKLRVGLDVYSGTDLDRFSRYSFDRFGAPVRGFAGSGIRFDKGAILRGAYVFNIANLIRFEFAVDQARVKADAADGESTNHTGLGLSGNVLGPWKTVWQLEYGYALRSDVKPVEGDQEILLIILKLF